jgi:hypothetical protein
MYFRIAGIRQPAYGTIKKKYLEDSVRTVKFKVFEECRLLGYKNPVLTSQETHYVSVTKQSPFLLCKI